MRLVLVFAIRLYRVSLGYVDGGSCRFYPSCSAYAEEAIGRVGALRGLPLALWRIARCSPLSAGGIDHPPQPTAQRPGGRQASLSDAVIQGPHAGRRKLGAVR